MDHRDLDSVEDAKREIISQIQALETDSSKLETPISVSLDLQTLRQSDNPEQRSLADVLSVITELRSSVSGIEKRLDQPESLVPMAILREFVERDTIRSSRSRRVAVDIQETIRDLQKSIDESSEDPRARKRQMDRIMRLEEMFMVLLDRKF